MNVPARVGRLSASYPFAELVMDETSLRLRPRWYLQWLFTDFHVDLDQIPEAFPATGRSHGVGFRRHRRGSPGDG